MTVLRWHIHHYFLHQTFFLLCHLGPSSFLKKAPSLGSCSARRFYQIQSRLCSTHNALCLLEWHVFFRCVTSQTVSHKPNINDDAIHIHLSIKTMVLISISSLLVIVMIRGVRKGVSKARRERACLHSRNRLA